MKDYELKARALVMSYFLITKDIELSKTCALIAVDEIISINIKYHGREIENNLSNIEYWQEVKKEIEKL